MKKGKNWMILVVVEDKPKTDMENIESTNTRQLE